MMIVLTMDLFPFTILATWRLFILETSAVDNFHVLWLFYFVYCFFFPPLLMQLLICHWTLSTDFASLLSFFTYFLSLYFPSSFGEISSTSPSNYYNMFAYFLNLSYHSYIYPLALSYSQTVPSSKNPALNL